MKVSRMLVVVTTLAALTATYAQAQNVLLKAAVKGTGYRASGGKIVKQAVSSQSIITDCTNSVPGSQLVLVFDTNTMAAVELDVVSPCGVLECQVATFGLSDGGQCVDTGAVSGSGTREIICPIAMTVIGGGDGSIISDLKLSFSQGQLKGGSLKGTGVLQDDAGRPSTISITAGALFKPASTCH